MRAEPYTTFKDESTCAVSFDAATAAPTLSCGAATNKTIEAAGLVALRKYVTGFDAPADPNPLLWRFSLVDKDAAGVGAGSGVDLATLKWRLVAPAPCGVVFDWQALTAGTYTALGNDVYEVKLNTTTLGASAGAKLDQCPGTWELSLRVSDAVSQEGLSPAGELDWLHLPLAAPLELRVFNGPPGSDLDPAKGNLLAPGNEFASRSVGDRRLENDNVLPLFDGSLGTHPNQGLGVYQVRVRNGTNRAVKVAFFVPSLTAGLATSSRTIAQNSPQIGTTTGTYTPPPSCYFDPGNRFRVTAADGSSTTSYACPPGWSVPPTNDPVDAPVVPSGLFSGVRVLKREPTTGVFSDEPSMTAVGALKFAGVNAFEFEIPAKSPTSGAPTEWRVLLVLNSLSFLSPSANVLYELLAPAAKNTTKALFALHEKFAEYVGDTGSGVPKPVFADFRHYRALKAASMLLQPGAVILNVRTRPSVNADWTLEPYLDEPPYAPDKSIKPPASISWTTSENAMLPP